MPTAGQIYYNCVHRPCRFVRRFCAYDGFVQTHVNRWQAEKMREAASRLRLPSIDAHAEHDVHYLTGRGHWHFTVFGAASLVIQTKGAVRPVFHSDGSLDDEIAMKLRAVFPRAECVYGEEQEESIKRYAPAGRFPVLNKLWQEFPLFRKLFAIHLWREGWSLCLDSDMLFWSRPDFLLEWLRAPERPVCMKDLKYAYSVEPKVLEAMAGGSVPALVNTGVIGLHSSMIEPGELEASARALLDSEGYNHFLEQTMTALLLAQRQFDYAPLEDYYIPEKVALCSTVAAVCQHYTPVTRGWFYQKGWQKIRRMAETVEAQT